MPLTYRAIAAALTILLLSGCRYPQTQEYFINPDGSGKVVYECEEYDSAAGAILALDVRGTTADAMAPEFKKEFIEKSKGVAVWKDIAVRRGQRGLVFRGTAYFDDVSKLMLHRSAPLLLKASKNEKGEFEVSTERQPGWRDPILELLIDDKLSEAKIKELLAGSLTEKEKQNLMAKLIAESASAKLKSDVWKQNVTLFELIIHVPGRIKKAVILTPDKEKNVLRLLYSHDAVIKAHLELLADEEYARKFDPEAVPIEDINQKLFEKKAMPGARVDGSLNALFDYQAEVEAAKKDFAALPKE